MHGRNPHNRARWARLTKVSADKGPYKVGTFTSDGKDEFDAQIIDLGGMHTNPVKESIAFLIPLGGDDGRVVALVMPPPALRVDQLKEGECVFCNHKTGQYIKLDDAGNIVMKPKKGGVVHLNPPTDDNAGASAPITA